MVENAIAQAEPAPTTDQCSRCVIPRPAGSQAPAGQWTCGLCLQVEHRGLDPLAAGKGTGDIEQIIQKIRDKGQGRRWDCLIGLSGGRDSSYLAYLLTQVRKLRCLAAYYRTPFTHDVIDQNVRRITQKLRIELVEINVSSDYHTRVARDFFLMWKRKPLPELSNLACAPCKLLNREVFRIAKARGIASIVFGGNAMEVMQFLPTYQAETGAQKIESLGTQTAKLVQIVKKGVGVFCTCPRVVRHLPLAVKASLLYLNPHAIYLRLRHPGIFRVDYFLHAPYSEAECLRVIREELGWRLPPGYSETWRADCAYAAVRDLMYKKMIGPSYLECMLSNLVRAGQITREVAISRLEANASAARLKIEAAVKVMGLPANILD